MMIEELFNSALKPLKLSALINLDVAGLVQVIILLVMVLIVYAKFIKNTSSEKLVNGIFASLFFLWILSEILKAMNLTILSTFLQGLIFTVIVSFVVIFQPELRRFMGYLGQKTLWNNYLHRRILRESGVNPVKELLEAVKHLKKNKIGALMVIQANDSASAYTEVGTKLNAQISAPLILTIFHPNTPLHDGAVVIQNDIIMAAGVLLPLTDDPKLSWKYGTRHRAAIGMSEVCDCACLVVSEETGDVSIALEGSLKRYEDFNILKTDLENLMGFGEEKNCSTNLLEIFSKKKKGVEKE